MAFVPAPLASETIFFIGSFPVRNTVLATWIVMAFLILGAYLYFKRSKNSVPRGFQNVIEAIIETAFNFFNSVTGNKEETRKFFPIVMTIFVFVLTANLFGLMPGFGPIGICEVHHVEGAAVHSESEQEAGHDSEESATETGEIQEGETVSETSAEAVEISETHEAAPEGEDHGLPAGTTSEEHEEGVCPAGEILVPIFRSVNSDVNMTLALAVISVIATQIYGMMTLGFFSYAGKFFVNPLKDFIGSFVGILELVSEFAKVISFSFRLFGNIFAGEVLLLVISFLAPFIAPMPFYGLELFVAFIQALVFSMLTLVFMKMAVTAHAHPEGEEHHHAEESPKENLSPAVTS